MNGIDRHDLAEDEPMADKKEPHIIVKDMTLAYGSNVVQHNVSFTVNHGDVFIIMGGSGCPMLRRQCQVLADPLRTDREDQAAF